MNAQQVLRRPFNAQTHKRTFINYLEVIILEDGTIEYSVPSHVEKLMTIACKKFGKTREEIDEECPPSYYFRYMDWLCDITNSVALWVDMKKGTPNEAQKERIQWLKDEGIYQGDL